MSGAKTLNRILYPYPLKKNVGLTPLTATISFIILDILMINVCMSCFCFIVVIAVAVPTIGPFIGLIGAFCFSLLGIIVPLIIEFATYWDDVTAMMTIRNLLLITVGILALVFGTANSIADIIATYGPAQSVTCAINSTLTQPIAE